MDSIVSVSRSEWDSFLADHSKLLERYELLLTQLDAARQELGNLRVEEQTRIEASRAANIAEFSETAPPSSETVPLHCSFCYRDLGLLDKFCDGCGRVVETIRCTFCGKQLDRDANFCIACGRRTNRL
jgi:hypothetical protein